MDLKFICKQFGHWKNECPLKGTEDDKRAGRDADRGGGRSSRDGEKTPARSKSKDAFVVGGAWKLFEVQSMRTPLRPAHLVAV